MATLKTQKNQASVDDFLATVKDAEMQSDCRKLIAIMQQASGEQACMWGQSMVGFGSYHYRYASGREGDWFLVGFAPRKRELSIYIMPGFTAYDDFLQKLGKHKTGKSCLYVRRLADIDIAVLQQLIESSVRDMRLKYH